MKDLIFSLSYATSYGLTFEDFMAKAHDLNFSNVQLIPDQKPNLCSQFSDDRIEKILNFKEKMKIDLSVHNVFYDINLLSLVPEVKHNSFYITKNVLSFCQKIDATSLTLHLGYMFPGWRRDKIQRDRFWNEAENSLLTLSKFSKDYNMPILFENGSYHLCTATSSNRSPLHVGITPSEMENLLDLCNRELGICFDINKAIHSGCKISNFLKRIGPSVEELQLSKITNSFELEEVRKIIKYLNGLKKEYSIVFEGNIKNLKRTMNKLGL